MPHEIKVLAKDLALAMQSDGIFKTLERSATSLES